MKNKRYFLFFALTLVMVFTGVVMGAPKKPTTVAGLSLYRSADRQQILEEGARKEGKLMFYTTGQLTQAVRPKVKAFQKKYPYIKVEIWRAGSRQLLPRVLEEYSRGRNLVDVLEIVQGGQLLLEERGILRPFYSPNIAFIEKGAIRKTPGGGAFAAGHYVSGYGIAYNTRLMTREEVPKTYQDLLDPKWKGKAAISTGNSAKFWMGAMLLTHGEDFVRRIAKQDFDVHATSSRAVLDMVIAQEYLFSPTQSNAHVYVSKKKGAPVEWIPLEPVSCFLGQIALPKHPPHPHAALLFIDFDLSKEAGGIYKATGYVSPRIDVAGELTFKKSWGPSSTKQFMQWSHLFNELFMKK